MRADITAWTLLLSIIAYVIKIITALGIGYKVLVWVNKKNGLTMERLYEILEKSPEAFADYHRGRLIAVALVIMGVTIGSLW